MSKQLQVFLLILFLPLCHNALAVQSTNYPFPSEPTQDSLILQKINSEKQIVIQPGQKLKIWQMNKLEIAGTFKLLEGDSVLLMDQGAQQWVFIDNIKKIKIYNGTGGMVVGGVLSAFGAAGMVLGGISLVAGTIALLADDLGALILVAVPILAGGGFGIYKLGQALSGKKLNLKKNWKIVDGLQYNGE